MRYYSPNIAWIEHVVFLKDVLDRENPKLHFLLTKMLSKITLYLKKYLFLLVFSFISCYLIFTNVCSDVWNEMQYELSDMNMEQEDIMNYCKRPVLKLWPRDVRDLNLPPKPSRCRIDEFEWTEAKNGILSFTKTGLDNRNGTSCKIHIIDTREDIEHLPNNFKETYIIDTIPFVNGMKIPSDVYTIKCFYSNVSIAINSVYENIGLNVKYNKKISLIPNPNLNNFEPKWNILIWSFDSLSKLSWHRYLPETVKTFEQYNGIWMKYMNALGKASITNIQPLLTGTYEKEVRPETSFFNEPWFIDDLPWIWNPLKKLNYVTLFGDSSTFNRRHMAFKNKPTHHYIRPWMMQVEKDKHKHERYCINSKKRISIIHNYIEEFWEIYKNNPKFAFVNYKEMSLGNFVDIQLADKYQDRFLKNLKSSGNLENTFVIFMSDHGVKRGLFRKTIQSNYELLNPYFGIIVPKLFEKLHPEKVNNIKSNIDKMFTTFDVHATLSDLINMVSNGDIKVSTHPGSISLFKKIKYSRKCSEANIKDRFCFCNEYKIVETTDNLVKNIANHIIKNITETLKPLQSYCLPIKFLKVEKASFNAYNRLINRLKDFQTKEYNYNVQILTDQHGTIYNGFANVRIKRKTNRPFITLLSVSRINNLRKMVSSCLEEKYSYLSQFCFCK